MSLENVELVRAVFEAWNARNGDAVREMRLRARYSSGLISDNPVPDSLLWLLSSASYGP
jgi:hypothetical protein